MSSSRILIPLALTLATFSACLAHDDDAQHAAKGAGQAKEKTAVGYVFDDLNQNRRRDPGEPGIPNVKVSNGRQIVRTDASGKYQISVTDDTIIFVIKPRGWMSPLDRDNLPQFFYIHKPQGSPKTFKFAGVAPTGPLPKSVDFAMNKQDEPNAFKAIMFGDPQPRNVKEVEYIAHDVIEQIIADEGHDASFGVTLGDIVFDDLDVMQPLNQAIALIGIPWYNVIGNHDLNLDAPNDELSDETFERHYGPSYYSFDHGPTHFLILDDVTWVAAHDGQKAHYHAGLGEKQLEFIRNDLAAIPEDQLVVLIMHIPLDGVKDREDLFRLIEQRPATVSLSAHTHYMEHRLLGKENGWKGPERHHHIVNVTVCGSWWRGQPDERGIPHATMSDGAPNGYSIMSFDGSKYGIEFRAAGRPANHQMQIYAPESTTPAELATTVVLANVFGASEFTKCEMRVGDSKWMSMEQLTMTDPGFLAEAARELALTDRSWTELPRAHATPHMYRAMLPVGLKVGGHRIEIRATERNGRTYTDHRIIWIKSAETGT